MKIHIFGASGSGVTTTGNALAEKLAYRYFDSDDYFWEKSDVPFTLRRNPEERNSKIKSDLENSENWILGGSIFQWGENVFPDFDLVVYLWIPPQIRMERLKKREFERYGNVIYTNPDRIKQFEDFMEWAADYDNNTGIASRNFQAHENWLNSIDFPVLKISGDLTLQQRIDLIIENINKKPLH
ncbi:ATP-binding protein [Flavobacterium johnsoniae]|uniref:Adenylate kinase and related kinase-like protein n=1 Tax=Flavobacterium johnsoniae (strain ATCC 17061 / DSM 2064 / JCM 8514 / BCRC 14874 / CCUG 350202 / NBRC 14942 / NCIMB 11054 / UW101) TaxID=376686 RepID=A5FEV5_FLAJ1|nr:AAA family ATPase [Flavobacterium johnsoniae]ABQ06264.1 Adenylate kinase and related kinase-like protein [Flavobacterium johnsoniae UW101]OXE98267.1 adenylate kinase [Flavobacterium johnsoniae UW101]WQG82011.1 adenylate kinase [Flavobacterium johnsoniae UW101]SHK70298.1 Adenylate kinase [Flavobacterium johnsoniae]